MNTLLSKLRKPGLTKKEIATWRENIETMPVEKLAALGAELVLNRRTAEEFTELLVAVGTVRGEETEKWMELLNSFLPEDEERVFWEDETPESLTQKLDGALQKISLYHGVEKWIN
jgi:hypothetical protein